MPDSGYAKTILDLIVGDSPLSQAGKKLEITRSPVLNGHCRLADGRAMADAEVEAHASSSLLAALPLTERERRRWPRTVSTRTDALGDFVLPVDPGTFDVVVRPREGSRFPWLVSPEVIVVAKKTEAMPLDPLQLVVPVPRHLPITLHDDSDNPLINALVRVYVGHVVSGGTVAIEIGRVRTGLSGEFDLFLDPHAK